MIGAFGAVLGASLGSCTAGTRRSDQRSAGDPADIAADSVGRVAERYLTWFFAGATDSLWSRLSDRGRQRWPHADSLGAFRGRVAAVITGLERVLRDSVTRSDTLVTWTRYGVNARDGATYYVRLRLTPSSYQLSAIGAQDAGVEAETPYLEYRPRTVLRVPFAGEWFVFWGGRTVGENYHAAYPHQRFALDLAPMADSVVFARVLRGEQTKLTDFQCFGHPVLAPAAGRVAAASDTVADHPAGEVPPHAGWGNHVVIDHGTGEYSLLDHLQHGSVAVRIGQSVEAGDRIGACGNSGRSSHPHVHFDLLTHPFESRATFSMPAKFGDVEVDGVLHDRAELRRWQRIRAGRR